MGRCFGALLVTSCTVSSPQVAVDHVNPGSGPNTVEVPVQIVGVFHVPLTSDLDKGNIVAGAMTVTVGGVDLVGASWRGEQLIEGTVPSGLPVGPQDVVVSLGTRTSVLAGGYIVEAPTPICLDYTITTPASSSKYRIISTEDTFWTQHALCNADAAGATHLAAFETAEEANALETVIATYTPAAPSGGYFVGAVQQPDQLAPDAGWYTFTGGPLPPGLWVAGEPDDSSATDVETNAENTATLNVGSMLHDTTGSIIHGAICECDGQAIDAAVATYIPAMP